MLKKAGKSNVSGVVLSIRIAVSRIFISMLHDIAANTNDFFSIPRGIEKKSLKMSTQAYIFLGIMRVLASNNDKIITMEHDFAAISRKIDALTPILAANVADFPPIPRGIKIKACNLSGIASYKMQMRFACNRICIDVAQIPTTLLLMMSFVIASQTG